MPPRDLQFDIKANDRTRAAFNAVDRQIQQSKARAAELNRTFTSTAAAAGVALRGAAVGGAVAGALSLAGAIGQARKALADFDEVGKQARISGLSPELYQALSFAAIETGVSQEKLNAAVLIFAKNAGLAKRGQGELASGLKQINPELLRAIQLAKTQDERLRLVAEAMRQARTQAERAALAATAFGRSGVELTEIFGAGAAGLDDFMRRAEEMGLIIDRELLAKADELDDKLAVLGKVIETNVNVALVEMAPLLLAIAEAAASLARDVRYLVETWNQFADVLRLTPEGARMLERFKGLAFDLDLGAERMRKFDEAAMSASEQLDAFLERWLNSPEAPLLSEEEAKQIGQIRELLAVGTPEAADAARVALERLVREAPQFQPLADRLAPLIGALDDVKRAAQGAGDAVEGMANTPVPSASDLARAAGREQARKDAAEVGEAFADAAKRGLRELISLAEGTGPGTRGYNETLDFGRWTGGDVNLTSMTLREIRALQEAMRTPENRRLYGGGRGSSALGKFQITGATLDSLIDQLGLSMDQLFTPELQDRLADALIQRRGRDVGGLRNEWEGLRRVPQGDILRAFDASGAERSLRAGEDMERQMESRAQFLEELNREIAALGLEAEAFGQTQAQAARAQAGFEALARAKEAGLEVGQRFSTLQELEAVRAGELTPELERQRQAVLALADAAEMRVLADQNSALAADQLAAAQDRLIGRMDFLRDASGGVLSSFNGTLMRTKSLTEALKAAGADALQILIRLAEQAAITALFGQQGTAGGGLLGGIIGSLFGAAGGAPRIPAGLPAAIAAAGKFGPVPTLGGGTAEPALVQIVADEGAMFVPRVVGISGQVAVEQIRASEVGLPARLANRQRRGLA